MKKFILMTLLTGAVCATLFAAEPPAADATAVVAAAGEAAKETPQLNPGDTAWMITATALVLFMTLPGWRCSTAGWCGRRMC
jgi:Amt family ammonium transporter